MIGKNYGSHWILRIDKGEELVSSLTVFCNAKGISAGTVSAIGAASRVVIGAFDTITKEYADAEFVGLFEIVSVMGSISSKDGNAYPHLHIAVADGTEKMLGGHLKVAIIDPTCELFIQTIDGRLERKFEPTTGLNLLSL